MASRHTECSDSPRLATSGTLSNSKSKLTFGGSTQIGTQISQPLRSGSAATSKYMDSIWRLMNVMNVELDLKLPETVKMKDNKFKLVCSRFSALEVRTKPVAAKKAKARPCPRKEDIANKAAKPAPLPANKAPLPAKKVSSTTSKAPLSAKPAPIPAKKAPVPQRKCRNRNRASTQAPSAAPLSRNQQKKLDVDAALADPKRLIGTATNPSMAAVKCNDSKDVFAHTFNNGGGTPEVTVDAACAGSPEEYGVGVGMSTFGNDLTGIKSENFDTFCVLMTAPDAAENTVFCGVACFFGFCVNEKLMN
ncbi:hypothetical protein B0H17DRAFT_1150375 [Mycena rosella]|uniref:Uncharacterized protein n=1 Tax=Mycena rosella TaxID=1033263 RepID=A0AAD7BSS1_MYCRO|nr:hypothetical protein B0H17DRAFT_1150375 [Mycena rosella]